MMWWASEEFLERASELGLFDFVQVWKALGLHDCWVAGPHLLLLG